MKFDRPRPRFGTDEDLRRILLTSFPGCRSVTEALAKETSKLKPNPPQDLPLIKESYEAVLRSVIEEISYHLNGYNIDLLDKIVRDRLSKMPIDSVENLKFWRDAWLKT